MEPSCAGFILFSPSLKRVVLIKTHNGVYGFPKGKRNKGESSIDAAYRETTEETGIAKEQIMPICGTMNGGKERCLLYVDEPSQKGTVMAVRLYLGYIDDILRLKAEDTNEIASVEWMTVANAEKVLMQKRKDVLRTAFDLAQE